MVLVLTLTNGDIIKGSFINDFLEGYGTFISNDGDTYHDTLNMICYMVMEIYFLQWKIL